MKECPLCRSRAKRRFGLEHTAAWACTSPDCGLFFADPQLDENNLADAYARHYYPSNGNGNGNAAVYENTPHEILRQTFANVETALGPLEGRSLLDFGCGTGGLCQVAKEYGLHVTGIEPDPNAREKARKCGGLRAYASLDSLRKEQAAPQFDFITMWDVVEHLREPWKELKELSTVLRPEGWLLLSTMNAGSLRAIVERQRWVNMINPTHFYYFTRRSLRSVFDRSGFMSIDEWRFAIRYPGHTVIRRIVNRGLWACGMHGQLVFVARPAALNKARVICGSRAERGTEIHAAD
jgi:2-polyprenyl-3-methyl-5-hydroxy-6-metoxy-1,4-benzoquinol methylase